MAKQLLPRLFQILARRWWTLEIAQAGFAFGANPSRDFAYKDLFRNGTWALPP